MRGIKLCTLFCYLFFVAASSAQTVEISGKVFVDDTNIEGIHVINKTANKFTITNSLGDFTIPAKLNDTIIFSSIVHKPKEMIVDQQIMQTKRLSVYLTELVNELDEVVVGKVLTGDLLSDIDNSDAIRDINFYDLGIPGYTGKPLTQSERRLKEATTGGGIIPLNPIINAITGRTKKLKKIIEIERTETCLESIKSEFSKTFFETYELEDQYRTEFFIFCSEDEDFSRICQIKNGIQTMEFLGEKLKSYKANLQTTDD